MDCLNEIKTHRDRLERILRTADNYERVTNQSQARKNDCDYCSHLCKRMMLDELNFVYFCNMDICPAEEEGYDAEELFSCEDEQDMLEDVVTRSISKRIREMAREV